MLRTLNQIIRTGILTETARRPAAPQDAADLIHKKIQRIFGRTLCIRHVDAGSCNACELELHALNNPYYNLEGLGIKFVASPRHADLLLVTGPVSRHMQSALKRTYAAIPEPKWVMALGDCGCNGGIFGCSYASAGPVAAVIPVDATLPGCPPTPGAILEGILALLEKPHAMARHK